MTNTQLTDSSIVLNRLCPGITLESLQLNNLPKSFKPKNKPQYISKNKINTTTRGTYTERNNTSQTIKNSFDALLHYSKGDNDGIRRKLAQASLMKKPPKTERNITMYNPLVSSSRKVKVKTYDSVNKSDIYYPHNYKDFNAEVLKNIIDCKTDNEKTQSRYKDNNNSDSLNDLHDSIPISTTPADGTINNTEGNINEKQGNDLEKTITSDLLNSLIAVTTILDPVYDSLSFVDKIEKLYYLTEDNNKDIRLGSLVSLYLINKKYKECITEDISSSIISKVISLLESYKNQDEIFLVACLEICSLYGPIPSLLSNIKLLTIFLTDFNHPVLQKAAFNCLMSLESEGIKTLVELSSKDYPQHQHYILNSLLQTPHIQKIIIIRALINEIYSINNQRLYDALAALNRMHDLITDDEVLEKITLLLYNPKIKKDFIVSILRTCGNDGETILLHEMQTNHDVNVRIAIAKGLSYRLPKTQKYLKMRLDRNDAESINRNLPGSFCTYYGSATPFVHTTMVDIDGLFENDKGLVGIDDDDDDDDSKKEEEEEEEDYVEVNTRDFLAALNRMITMTCNHSNPQLVHYGNVNHIDNIDFDSLNNENEDGKQWKYRQFFDIKENKEGTNNNSEKEGVDKANFINSTDNLEQFFISENIIVVLCKYLKDHSSKVREACANSLGLIGEPEAVSSIYSLIEHLNDPDIDAQNKIIWAISQIASSVDNTVIQYLLEALIKSNIWKVKKTLLYALTKFDHKNNHYTVAYIEKLLKDSLLNKPILAETMIKLGVQGESVLLKLMNLEPNTNYKLKSAILQAFTYANMTSPNIDFIIECIFKQGKNNSNSQVRKSALVAIRFLSDKSNEKITYLKKKYLIPFYYDKLKDKDNHIQAYAIDCIKALGSQGELIFIEGLKKDPNTIVRINCAIGLGKLGAHTLNILLLGLSDKDTTVSKVIERIIVDTIKINDVINLHDSLSTILSTIKDILDKNLQLSQRTIDYFSKLSIAIEKNYTLVSKDN